MHGTLTPLRYFEWRGKVYIRKDLPAPDSVGRWTMWKKLLFVQAIKHGLITAEEFSELYSVGKQDIDAWINRYR